jgi:hypothetical protein
MATYNFTLNSSNNIGINNNTYQLNFKNGSFTIPEGSEMSISQLTVPYSFRNITALQGNNTYSYTMPTSSGVITFGPYTIPDGFYLVSDLNNIIQAQLKANGHYFYLCNQTQFSGSISASSNTLTVSNSLSSSLSISVGNTFSFYNPNTTSIDTRTITAQTGAYTYTFSGSALGTTPTSNPSSMTLYYNDTNVQYIYPINVSVYTPLYTNQVLTYLLPTAANIQNTFGQAYRYADGLNNQSTWTYGYPTTGNQQAQLIFSSGLGKILGFNSGTYPSSSTVSSGLSTTTYGNTIPLATSVNAIVVRCNLIANYISNNCPTDILDTAPINATYGSNIQYLPISDNFIQLRPGTYSSLVITLCDQNYNPLYALDNNVLMTFLIKFPENKKSN